MRIVKYPSPILKRKSKDVSNICDEKFQIFVDNMIKAMYEYDGIGLAAPQVGHNLNVLAMDISGGRDEFALKVIINPKILAVSDDTEKREEGCLSFPGIYGNVERPTEIKISYSDRDGRQVEETLKNLEARVFLHEFDHLIGVWFIEKIEDVDKLLIKGKLKKLERDCKKGEKVC